jgi:hypothetical protein
MATAKVTAKKRVQPVQQVQATQEHEDTGYGVTSLVLGISSILLPFLGIVTGVLAIIFANKQKKIKSNGMATAGMVTGIIGLVIHPLTLFVVLVFVILFGALMGSLAVAPGAI